MVSRKKKLADLVTQPGAASVIKEVLETRRLKPDGKLHDFYTWLPRCAPYVTEGVRPGSVPNVTFHRDLPQSKAETVAVVTSNGSGKSRTGAHLTASRAIGRHPVFKNMVWTVPQLIWVCGEPDLLSGLFELVVKFIPKQYIDRKLENKSHQYIKLKNGSEIKFKSYGMDTTEFQMDNVNFIWCDEEPPKKHWIEMQARLRCPDSQMLLTFTPVKGTTFMHDELEISRWDKYANAMDGKIALFKARMEDNDTLPQSYIDKMKHACRNDKDMYAIRIEGDYREMRGRSLLDEEKLGEISELCHAPKRKRIFDASCPPCLQR